MAVLFLLVLPTFTVLFLSKLLSICKNYTGPAVRASHLLLYFLSDFRYISIAEKRKLGIKAYHGGFGGLHPILQGSPCSTKVSYENQHPF